MASNQALGVVVPDDKRGMVGYGSREHVIDTLEKAVAGRDYLAGDRFTAADLYVGAQIGWGLQFGTIEKRPAFEEYAGRVLSRPAALRAREIDDGLIAQQRRRRAEPSARPRPDEQGAERKKHNRRAKRPRARRAQRIKPKPHAHADRSHHLGRQRDRPALAPRTHRGADELER